jgi:hypothetical protein
LLKSQSTKSVRQYLNIPFQPNKTDQPRQKNNGDFKISFYNMSSVACIDFNMANVSITIIVDSLADISLWKTYLKIGPGGFPYLTFLTADMHNLTSVV